MYIYSHTHKRWLTSSTGPSADKWWMDEVKFLTVKLVNVGLDRVLIGDKCRSPGKCTGRGGACPEGHLRASMMSRLELGKGSSPKRCIFISVCQTGVDLEDTTMNKPHLFVQQSVVVSIVQSHNFYIIDILTDTSLFKRQAIIGSRPFDVVAVVLHWST